MTLTTSSAKEFSAAFKFSFKSQLSAVIVHTVILFFVMPFVLAFVYVNAYDRASVLAEYFKGAFPFIITPVMIIFVLIHSALLFKYMHQKRSVDLFHAFPIKRTPLLLGRFAVEMLSLFIPITVNLIISYIMAVFFGEQASAVIASVFKYGLIYLLFAAAVASFAMLLAVCSGTTMEMFVSGVLICASWPLLILFAHATVNSFLPGFAKTLSPTVVLAFSPVIAAVWGQGTSLFAVAYEKDAAFYIWHLALSVVYIIGAVLIYKSRKSENAENVHSFSPVKIIIRTLTTLCAGLGFGYLFSAFFDSLAAFWFGTVFGSAVVHIITEALYMHTLKAIAKSLKLYAVCIVLIAVFVNIFSFGFFGWDTKTPELNDIESVSISFPSLLRTSIDNEYFQSYFGGGAIVKGKDANGETLIEASPRFETDSEIASALSLHYELNKINRKAIYPYKLSTSAYYSEQTVKFTYKLKNGEVFERSVRFDASSGNYNGLPEYDKIIASVKKIASNDEYYYERNLAYYLEPSYFDEVTVGGAYSSYNLELTETQKAELIAALLADTKELILEEKNPQGNGFEIQINFTKPFVVKEGDKINKMTGYTGDAVYTRRWEYYIIGENCKNTIEFMRKNSIDIDSLNTPHGDTAID